MSFSSSIIGPHADGIPPLQAKATLKLKLNYNCVRPATWSAKLGYTGLLIIQALHHGSLCYWATDRYQDCYKLWLIVQNLSFCPTTMIFMFICYSNHILNVGLKCWFCWPYLSLKIGIQYHSNGFIINNHDAFVRLVLFPFTTSKMMFRCEHDALSTN